MAAEPKPGGLCLEPISGVRFINMLLLVCVHRVLNVFRGPVHNYLDVAHVRHKAPSCLKRGSRTVRERCLQTEIPQVQERQLAR